MVQAAIKLDKDKKRFERVETGKLADLADLRNDDNNTNEEHKIPDKVEENSKAD